jgi:5-methylcytosine-specific restriction endonuclease McrA
MKDVLTVPVLLLNRVFEPVQVTNARRAFVLLYGGAALALEDGELYDFDSWRRIPAKHGEDAVPVVGGAIRVPRVLHLTRYDRTPRTLVRLSRKNLMMRDGHQCQYCGRKPPIRDLNIDHVLPRCRGGRDAWDNLVTACKPCNLKKGSRTPDEAGIRLMRLPQRPKWSTAARILMSASDPFPEWAPYLRAG